MVRWMMAATAAMVVAGCTPAETGAGSNAATANDATAAAPAGGATAMLRTADGADAGRAVASEQGGGIRVTVEAAGVPAGVHGVHVHTVGRCDGPDFTTAGGHWNPSGRQHGAENPAGPHAGDLPNMTVGTDGRGRLEMMLPSGTMAGLLDADGAAFVIHAAADDLKSDPAGNSGGRIACGVFEAS